MPVITISRDCASKGREIAEKVAARLGLENVAREVVLQAAEAFGENPRTIEQALHDAPGFLARLFTHRERHLAQFRAALYDRLKTGNVVYHGLAGHMFLAGVPGVLKVRIIADFAERVAEEQRRSGDDIDTVTERLELDDVERHRWTRILYGTDNHDSSHYDLCLNLRSMSVDEAVDAIVRAADQPRFADAEALGRAMTDLALAARVEARLLESFPTVDAVSRDSELFVRVAVPMIHDEYVQRRAQEIVSAIPGVSRFKLQVQPDFLDCV